MNTMSELRPPSAESPAKIVRLAVLFEGGVAVAAIACGYFMTIPPWQRVSWQWGDAGWGVAATIPLILGLLLMRRARRGAGAIERGGR